MTRARKSKMQSQVQVWLVGIMFLSGGLYSPTAAQETAVLEAPPQPTSAKPAAKPADSRDDGSNVKTKPDEVQASANSTEFVRILKKEDVPQALQTAVAKYRKTGQTDGPEVSLIGAVHIGESTYYSQLNQLFRTYDALLYELVAEPDAGVPDPKDRGVSPISTIQVGLKDSLELEFQLDEIDYKAKNFVHADMTPKEFFDTMDARKEGVLQMFFRSLGAGIAMQSSGKGGDIGLLTALVATDRTKALRRAFAEQMQMMEGQMNAITGNDGKSTLITERNAKAFEVLDRELKAGKQKLGVFYGAGHLKDMHERLQKDFGMELVEIKWLNAWELQ